MDRKIIVEGVVEAVEKTVFRSGHKKPQPVTEATNPVEDLGADSLHCIEIILFIEERFDIEVSDAEAEDATTVSKMADIVARKVGGRG